MESPGKIDFRLITFCVKPSHCGGALHTRTNFDRKGLLGDNSDHTLNVKN